MDFNATIARCAFGNLTVPVRAIPRPGALNCTTPTMAYAHLPFSLSLNGLDFTTTTIRYRVSTTGDSNSGHGTCSPRPLPNAPL